MLVGVDVLKAAKVVHSGELLRLTGMGNIDMLSENQQSGSVWPAGTTWERLNEQTHTKTTAK